MVLFFRFVSDDVVVSFSKKRYRATVPVTSRPGTSIVTVQASTGNTQIAVHYSILSVNRKPYSGKTTLFGMESVTGTVYCMYNSICYDFLPRSVSHRLSGNFETEATFIAGLKTKQTNKQRRNENKRTYLL